jgi:hypothetical protein
MYDSVYVFAKGLAALDRGHVLKPANLSCDLEQPWDDGLSLYNYINSVSNGFTSTLFHTACRGKVDKIPISHSGHPGFESQQRD